MNLAEKYLAMQQTLQANEQNTDHPVKNSGHTLFFDGMNSFIRCFAATKTLNDHGQHIGGLTGFLLSTAATIRFVKPSRVIIIFDGAGGSQRRRGMYDGYKDNRRSMTKLNRQYDFSSVEDEVESRKQQLMRLAHLLRYLPVTTLAPNNVEADDAIAYLAQHHVEQGGKSTIVSTDKDFLQLVTEDGITVWNPVKQKFYNPSAIVEDYGFHPHNFLLYRMITGDNSDNVPGVHGIGEKTLLKYFPQLADAEKRDLKFLLEEATRQINEKKKPPVALKNLVESKDILERNFSLMRLDEVAMSTTTRIAMLDAYDRAPNTMNKFEFMKDLAQDGSIRALGHFDSWFQQSFVPLTRYLLND